MSLMISCVMNVRVHDVLGSLPRIFVQMSLVCSTTATSAGARYTPVPVEITISHW